MFDYGHRQAHKGYMPLLVINNGKKEWKGNKKKWKWPIIIIIFWIITLILVGLVYLNTFFQLQTFISFEKLNQLYKFPSFSNKYSSINGYLVNTPGCLIPEMNPFDPSVDKFIFKPDEITCHRQKLPPLFESNLTSLFILTKHLQFYEASLNITDLNCCYKEFWRQKPKGTQIDDRFEYSKNCTSIGINGVNIDKEFLNVICTNQTGEKVYEDYFAFVPAPKKEAHFKSTDLQPNILILGMDGMSRLNVHRQLPKTYKYLVQGLGGVELLGYNKVADNTFPNLMAVLKGMYESELKKNCWPTTASRFDNCSFIWDNFSRNKYVTVLGEDCAWLGLFNYLKKGFLKQPTNYYYTSFNREMENKIGYYHDGNCNQCVGGKKTYRVILEYIRKFVSRMKLESTPYFGFFWSSTLSHDYLNRPALGDGDYYDLLNYLRKDGHLENTFLIFMSDHGIRFGDIRQTYQGQMEERLPFMLIAPPRRFRKNYPTAMRNLNKNKRVLTSPFDIHETLNALLNISKLLNAGPELKVSRGYSLFNEIPIDRTCEDAQIDSHWCTCQQSVEVTTNDSHVAAAAKFAVNNINSQLKGYTQCATLVLDRILEAKLLFYDPAHFTNKKVVVDYTVVLKTIPGGGVFEDVNEVIDELQIVFSDPNKIQSSSRTNSSSHFCQENNGIFMLILIDIVGALWNTLLIYAFSGPM